MTRLPRPSAHAVVALAVAGLLGGCVAQLPSRGSESDSSGSTTADGTTADDSDAGSLDARRQETEDLTNLLMGALDEVDRTVTDEVTSESATGWTWDWSGRFTISAGARTTARGVGEQMEELLMSTGDWQREEDDGIGDETSFSYERVTPDEDGLTDLRWRVSIAYAPPRPEREQRLRVNVTSPRVDEEHWPVPPEDKAEDWEGEFEISVPKPTFLGPDSTEDWPERFSLAMPEGTFDDQEELAAAQRHAVGALDRYQEYWAIRARNAHEGRSPMEELRQAGLLADPATQAEQEKWDDFTARGLRETGDIWPNHWTLTGYDGDPFADDLTGQRIAVDVCHHRPGWDLVGPDGASVRTEDSNSFSVAAELEYQDHGDWAVIQIDQKDGVICGWTSDE